MKPSRRMMGRPAFQLFLFCLGLGLLYWPFLMWRQTWREPHSFLFLYGAWVVLIAILFFMSRSFGPHLPKSKGRSRQREE